jgi:hypothetical protein
MKNPVEIIDLSELLEGLENKWVVLSKDNKSIIAFADEVEDLGGKINEGILMKVPDPQYSFAPTSF